MESGKPNQKNFNYNLGYSTRADTTINGYFIPTQRRWVLNEYQNWAIQVTILMNLNLKILQKQRYDKVMFEKD